jgi:alpha-tubulin suppressor-like RCC1 family protein
MAIIKCKMCGGDMELSPDKTFGTCEYCGSVMTLPKVDDDQRAAQFNRGNHFRRQGEFDKALAVYERIVAEDDTDAEAHWCCALCRFGIEYVEDPATYEYIPTCHRASFDSFLEDVDYLAAVEHSDGITRRQYQKDGAKIAEVQRAILATSQKEEPFDVFICYKETDDETKERTRDSLDAQEIYYNLTQEGYRVFFARITLEDKAGTEYEPYIFAALNSAKVMVVVGEKAEYFNAVWVKNEWSRFLSLMRKDRTKLLLPCYKNVDPYDLPEQLGVLQSYDMAKIGFMQDLIRGIKKVLQKDEPKETVKETVVVQQSPGGANITAQLKRGMQALEDKDWAAADGFFDKALDMDAECAEAFFGKALAAQWASSGESLVLRRLEQGADSLKVERLIACERDETIVNNAVEKYRLPDYLDPTEIRESFKYDERTYASMTKAWKERIAEEAVFWEGDRNLSRALRYAKGDFAETLSRLRKEIETRLERKLSESEAEAVQARADVTKNYADAMAQAERTVEEKRKAAEKKKEQEYIDLCKLQEKADSPLDYSVLVNRFTDRKWQGYKDCAERAEQCRAMGEKLKTAEEKAAAAAKKKKTTVGIIAAAVAVVIIAAAIVTVKVIIPSSKYKSAEAKLEAGDYIGAIAGFDSLGDYRDARDRLKDAWESRLRSLGGRMTFRDSLAGGGYHTVGLRSDGSVLAVGNNGNDQCNVGDWTDIVAVAAGGQHTVGLRADGTVLATGNNAQSECEIGGWTDIVDIAAGGSHTVGLRSNGTVLAVGFNNSGQCNVGDWPDIVAVAAGGSHTVGLRSDGTVLTVGFNKSGQCNVGDWTGIVDIAAGGSHTVGLRSDGTMLAVGNNESGQCNVGDWMDIVAVAAGRVHTVGLRSDGTVLAVGDRDDGRCNVDDWTDIVDIAAGDFHTLGLRADGTVLAVGYKSHGQCHVSTWTDIKLPG